MPLHAGTTLGPYRVTAKIGEGGMGEVWQAHDTKLDRDVALKVLPEAFTSDPDRLARFEREAKVLASLNHPNIGTIYGLEEAEGVRALVLELIEGPTLADRIAQGPIPLDDALPIAKQIAEALEAAHEAGVIHRDLKPANIKVKDDGTVKVLDFGLAKAFQPDPESDPSASPTVTAATEQGVILGTAAYMSPEQARGQTLDKRTDIWSFGCVLYEMLSGHRVFGKDTVIDTLSAVLESEPEWRLLPDVTPPGARRLLRRCLQKDRRRRCHDIADARIELEDLEGESADEGLAAIEQTATSGPRTGVLLPWVLMAVLGIILMSTLWMTRSGSPVPPPATTHLTIDLPPGHSLGGGGSYPVALSRDGRRLAYVAAAGQASTVGLFLRRLDDRTVREVADTEDAGYPFFSPDGESVGFWADGWLHRVPFTGGQPLRIAAVPVLDRGAAWGPDDTIVFASTTEGLQRVSVSGGTPEALADDGQWPEFIDDGRLLFVSGNEIQVLDLDAPQPQVLYASAEPVRQARMFPPGHLLYGSAGRVIAFAHQPRHTRGHRNTSRGARERVRGRLRRRGLFRCGRERNRCLRSRQHATLSRSGRPFRHRHPARCTPGRIPTPIHIPRGWPSGCDHRCRPRSVRHVDSRHRARQLETFYIDRPQPRPALDSRRLQPVHVHNMGTNAGQPSSMAIRWRRRNPAPSGRCGHPPEPVSAVVVS